MRDNTVKSITDNDIASCSHTPGESCPSGMLPQDCATLRTYVNLIVRLRWIVAAGAGLLVAAGIAFFPDAARWDALLVITAIIAALNIIWQIQTPKRSITACRGAIDFASEQIVFDFLLLAAAIFFTGGIVGPLTPFFVLHSVFSAVLLPSRSSYRIIALAVALMTLSFVVQGIFGFSPRWEFNRPEFLPVWADDAIITFSLAISTAGAAAIGLDISRKLRRRHSRIEALARELELRNEKLKKLDEQRVWLLGVASHDLKSPLSAVEMKLDMLAEGYMGDVSAAQKAEVVRMKGRLESLRLFINDILDITALESKGAQTEASQKVDVSAQLKDIISEQEVAAKGNLLTIEQRIPENPVMVMAPPRRLTRVWQNLVSNAIKYGTGGGKVEIECESAGGMARISIIDHGMGISHDDQTRLFTDFFRTADAKSRGIPGSGLGLSITKRIVEEAGGEIAVKSEPGKGSTFIVMLPAAPFPD